MVVISHENPVSIPAINLKKAVSACPDDWKDRSHPTKLVLFDVDGTLTPSRKVHHIPNLKYFTDCDYGNA
jgi:hypothetical protein